MRYLLLMLVLLAGCAKPRPAVEEPNAANFEGVCARSCLGKQSDCMQGLAGQRDGFLAGDIARACRRIKNECLSTCPPKP